MRQALSFIRWLVPLPVVLAGCVGGWRAEFLEPGVSNRAVVLQRAGPPDHIWRNADGSEEFEYAMQPYGTRCLKVSLNSTGVVTGVADALSGQNRARLQVGMTSDVVRRMMCQPLMVQHFPRMDEEVWGWNIRNPGGGDGIHFNAHFRAGRLLRVSESYYGGRDFMDGSP